MKIIFDKMQALGNDGIFINRENLSNADFNRLIKKKDIRERICDRHYGIGADILTIYETKKDEAGNDQVQTWFFNPDGSSAELCLNATRCLGLLLKNNLGLQKFDMVSADNIYPVDASNNKKIKVEIKNPFFGAEQMAACKSYDENIRKTAHELWPESEPEVPLDITVMNIGNPHLVILVQGSTFEDEKFRMFKEQMGIFFSQPNPYAFINGINVSFASVLNKTTVALEVYERGAGLTLGCGSAACAAAITAFSSDFIKPKVTVVQPGGKLDITITEDEAVIQEGPAHYVFKGEIEI